ncbi:unnamed protein product [Linum tenue]|uniref:Pectinesterase catalytic domain-containing protein n=1 Tax=Linum tenue TaxID=586396 RepID=A0AAV0Q3Q6_9ROSI|nr:unnamed protein product [Linum tenue]
MGFENSAGAVGHQAVAYRSQSDNSVVFNCQFDGYQDTLYQQTYRQFFRDCVITAYLPVKDQLKAYLGRPWKEYSRTVIMHTVIDGMIAPEGWLEWQGDLGLKTLYYAEFREYGSWVGSDGSGDLAWS